VTRITRRTSIVASTLVIVAGAGLALAAQSGFEAITPTAAAATQPVAVQGTDVFGGTTVSSWADVKAAGMSFTGVEAYDGASVPNTSYTAQVTGALGAGLYVMPYVLADPLKVATGAAQFANGWSVIDSIAAAPYASGGQYLPIVLDMESQPQVTSKACYGLSQSAMVSWIESFITAAKAEPNVATPIIYTNPDWWNTCTGNTTALRGYPLWIADYGVAAPTVPPGWSGYTFWQSSATATINGIKGQADLDQLASAPALITTTAGTAGSVTIPTLNSLAGQTVTYDATGVPNGASLTSNVGAVPVLSWTSATPVGRYPITVAPASTPPDAAVPASVSITLKLHGAITVASTSRSSKAGSPVSLQVAASGPDQTAGYPATLKATGLPTGLSMSATGLITGWPDKPGSYTVKVAASDALGGAGSASFGWTVTAAVDAGTAGTIKQVGGTGKCLDDPGSKTANGTPVDLSTCTGKSSQRWTFVADGTLRTGGKCLQVFGGSTASGAKLRLYTCSSADEAQVWQAATDGALVNVRSGKCLDVPVASAANGTRPVIEPCVNSTTKANQHWLRPAALVLSGRPGYCMGAGQATAGATVDLAPCANNALESWQEQPDGTLRADGKCLAERGTTVSSELSIVSCSGAAATKWKLIGKGPVATELASAASGLCVTIAPTGTPLIMAACAADSAGTWHVE
jgi:GH25 family lysozyme M1 (1,4-beta-N-acetylmuramidase)